MKFFIIIINIRHSFIMGRYDTTILFLLCVGFLFPVLTSLLSVVTLGPCRPRSTIRHKYVPFRMSLKNKKIFPRVCGWYWHTFSYDYYCSPFKPLDIYEQKTTWKIGWPTKKIYLTELREPFFFPSPSPSVASLPFFLWLSVLNLVRLVDSRAWRNWLISYLRGPRRKDNV